MNKETKKIIIGVVVAGLLVGVYFLNPNFDSPTKTYFCTMDAKQCPDGSYVGRTGPKCEFENCPDFSSLPNGYNLENSKLEKITGEICRRDSDCKTPGEYLVQSRCPFTSVCLENKCAVVCPGRISAVTFSCEAGKYISARFYPDYDDRVDLKLSDGRDLSLSRVISASGARYADADEGVVFWNKGSMSFLEEGKQNTYTNCWLTE
jgi:membrane-bound inhibitor of C-type lysozyme